MSHQLESVFIRCKIRSFTKPRTTYWVTLAYDGAVVRWACSCEDADYWPKCKHVELVIACLQAGLLVPVHPRSSYATITGKRPFQKTNVFAVRAR